MQVSEVSVHLDFQAILLLGGAFLLGASAYSLGHILNRKMQERSELDPAVLSRLCPIDSGAEIRRERQKLLTSSASA